MAGRIKKAVSLLLITGLSVSLLTGCDLPWGKKKAQQEVVETYLNACFEFDYRKAASCVQKKDDAFQEFYPESPQLEICEMILSNAQYEVEKIENDRVLVNITMPDIDRVLKRENVASLEVEDLEDMLSDTDKLLEERFDFDLIKDGKEWVIDPDSTEEFVEFISELGLEVVPEIGLGSRAVDFVDDFINCLKSGNIDAAYSMMYGNDYYGYSSVFGDDVNDSLSEFYATLFGSIEYEAEVVSLSSSSVTVELNGTRADLNSAISEVSANNAELSVPLIKQLMRIYLEYNNMDYSVYDPGASETFLYEYISCLVDFYVGCTDVADSLEFTCEIELEIEDDGTFSFVGDPLSTLYDHLEEPVFSEEFYEQALDELLASGEITQSEYDELQGMDADDLLSVI